MALIELLWLILVKYKVEIGKEIFDEYLNLIKFQSVKYMKRNV